MSFRLMGDRLDPDAITAATGIEPDACHRKGDPRARPKGDPYPPWRSGLWSISTEDRVSRTQATLQEHLDDLLERLEPAHEALLAVAAEQELEADFFCGYFMTRLNCGWELMPGTLRRIAALDAKLGMDVYGP